MFYGGGFKVLGAQVVGSAIVCSATFASAAAMFWVLNKVNVLRLSKEGELEGMDLDQHGISAYPEYVIATLAAPHGEGMDPVAKAHAVSAAALASK